MEQRLLDYIILHDGTELFGVVDYITAKHVYFFDFSHQERSDHLLVVAVWRGTHYKEDIRFSVYSILEFPQLPLPQATLISKSNIRSSSVIISPTKKIKHKKIKVQ